ncbi:MAG TPA: pseudomurein-binding repeat-containing protein [Methanobacterium sp.]|nr:MAG: hypothetical protein FGO69_00560 [Methanobacterium sp.]HOI71787.1 pseudomurein-binding repeat-containing protein [Methanobacterium sp.]
MTLAVIALLALVVFINVSEVSAASTTTVDTNSVVKSSDTVKNYIESKKTVPSTVTVADKNVTSEQYLYLLTSSVTNLNKNNKNAITVKTVAKAPKPSESITSGTLSKSEYINLANSITTFINNKGRLPNFISTSKGNMRTENMIYTYSKIVVFYKTNNRLPNFVAVAPWKMPNGGETNTPVTNSVDTNSVVKSSDTVKNYIESKKTVPSTITVTDKNVTSEQYLYLLTKSVTNINQNNKNTITIKSIAKAPNPKESTKSGTLSKSEYINLAGKITTFININGRLPNFISTSLGNMRPENLIYTYSKIVAFYKTNNRLPNTVSVVPWSSISKTDVGTGTGLRAVYIVSDNINNISVDNDRINRIVNELKNLGLQAYNLGVGPDKFTGNQKILTQIPLNTLVVQINGGACAGTIYEAGTEWYKSIMGNRKLFLVFTYGAASLDTPFLVRAWDDNFSSSSFNGLAYPGLYLQQHGIPYYEGYTNIQVTTLANLIYDYAKN